MITQTLPQVSPSTWTGFLEPMRTLTTKYIVPPLKALASKVDAVWQAVLPYLTKIAQFAMSKLGIASELFGTALVVSLLGHSTNNKVVSTACTVAGILIAGAGGYYLCASGALSAAISSL